MFPHDSPSHRMRRHAAARAASLVISAVLGAGWPLPVRPQAPAGGSLAITEVNIVDVRAGTILENSDLVITDGRIAQVGPHGSIQLPPGARTLAEKGRFVMPGLIDMHAHLSAVDDAPRMLSWGITGARHIAQVGWWTRTLMRFPDGRDLRDRIRRGALEGPDLVVAGMTLDGKPPISPLNQVITDPAKAPGVVREQVADGFDFVKIYDHLSAPVFEAVMARAASSKIPVAGHVPVDVGIDRALSSNLASIEHLTGYIDQHHVKFLIDEKRLKEYAERTKASGKVNCPTLAVWRNIPPKDSLERIKRQSEYQFLSWRVRWLWKTTLGYLDKKPYQGNDLAGDMTRLTVRMTRALHEAGAPIVAGTDMNFLGVYPGISLHQELEYLREAGLSDLDALRSATINAAKALGQDAAIGSIEPGKRANLVIVDGNPLRDIRATREIREVIKDGRRIQRSVLRSAAESPESPLGTFSSKAAR